MKKEEVVEYFIKIFWIFMIGSFIGFIVESIVVIMQEGHYESRQGLIYGPFVQIYGIGAVIYYLFVPKIKQKKNVFIVCMIVGGILEYLFSYIQQALFGTISWDYTNYRIHFNGRTSLLHCIYWGIAGILVLKIICPLAEKISLQSKNYIFRQITLLTVLLMMGNIIVSWSAANRQKERMKHIPPQDIIDEFLDKHYSDQVMDKVYANKKDKLKRAIKKSAKRDGGN